MTFRSSITAVLCISIDRFCLLVLYRYILLVIGQANRISERFLLFYSFQNEFCFLTRPKNVDLFFRKWIRKHFHKYFQIRIYYTEIILAINCVLYTQTYELRNYQYKYAGVVHNLALGKKGSDRKVILINRKAKKKEK